MLIDQIELLSSKCGDNIESILYDIQYRASKGCNRWEGIVISKEVFNYFKNQGFTVTRSSLTPLLITISWKN